jgi:hypothetical protein
MRSRKNIVAISSHRETSGGRRLWFGFHPTIVDKSQLIEAGLTRREIVKKIDWFDARIVAPVAPFCASTNSKP